jgi:hypothetical protein
MLRIFPRKQKFFLNKKRKGYKISAISFPTKRKSRLKRKLSQMSRSSRLKRSKKSESLKEFVIHQKYIKQ